MASVAVLTPLGLTKLRTAHNVWLLRKHRQLHVQRRHPHLAPLRNCRRLSRTLLRRSHLRFVPWIDVVVRCSTLPQVEREKLAWTVGRTEADGGGGAVSSGETDLTQLVAGMTGLDQRFDFDGSPLAPEADMPEHLGLYVRVVLCTDHCDSPA